MLLSWHLPNLNFVKARNKARNLLLVIAKGGRHVLIREAVVWPAHALSHSLHISILVAHLIPVLLGNWLVLRRVHLLVLALEVLLGRSILSELLLLVILDHWLLLEYFI